MAQSDKPGTFRGRHYTGWVNEVKRLKREKLFSRAETLLLGLITAAEEEAKVEKYERLPYIYYLDLAIVYRKEDRLSDELAILNRYRSLDAEPRREILERVTKVQLKLGLEPDIFEEEKSNIVTSVDLRGETSSAERTVVRGKGKPSNEGVMTLMSGSGQMSPTFAAIDFETATASRNSACSIGLVLVENGVVSGKDTRLIRPPGNRYDPFNISIHGITPDQTADADSFDVVWDEFGDLIGDQIVIAHNAAFDMSVLRHSAENADYLPPPVRFACSYRMAKDTWPGRWSYKLNDLAAEFKIDLDHHDALSDANAAAEVTLAILGHHGLSDISEVADVLGYRLGEVYPDGYQSFSNAFLGAAVALSQLTADGHDFDEAHPLFGRKVAFTGTLVSMSRGEAAQKAVNVGASVTNSVGGKLDYLVVGETDFDRVGSDGMSSKLRKAVELAESGKPLEIIGENDFLQFVNL